MAHKNDSKYKSEMCEMINIGIAVKLFKKIGKHFFWTELLVTHISETCTVIIVDCIQSFPGICIV